MSFVVAGEDKGAVIRRLAHVAGQWWVGQRSLHRPAVRLAPFLHVAPAPGADRKLDLEVRAVRGHALDVAEGDALVPILSVTTAAEEILLAASGTRLTSSPAMEAQLLVGRIVPPAGAAAPAGVIAAVTMAPVRTSNVMSRALMGSSPFG
jgi:hypothetical protein